VGHDVFIIHADGDKPSAPALRGALGELGIAAFVDLPDVRTGAPWATAIPRRRDREALVAALTPRSSCPPASRASTSHRSTSRSPGVRVGSKLGAQRGCQGDHPPGADGNWIGFRVACRPHMD
jgi:hypothetical protein